MAFRQVLHRDDAIVDDGSVVAGHHVTRERVWSPAQLIVLAAGVVLIVLGAIALIRGDLSGEITEPRVEVLGFEHTPLLGLLELGAGVLLVLSGLTIAARATALLLGILLVIGGVLILVGVNWVEENLTTDTGFGWIPIIVGGVVVLALMLVPEIHSRRTIAT
jgi:hypothetical protein